MVVVKKKQKTDAPYCELDILSNSVQKFLYFLYVTLPIVSIQDF